MSSLLGNFSVATTTNNVFTGTALNDILLTAQSNQKIWIGGASGASNVLSVGSNVTTTSNLEVTGLTSLSNLVITGTVVGFNGVNSNQSFSNVYSSNVYGSNAAFSNLIISSTQSNNGSLSVAGVLTSATLSNTGTLSNAGAALFSSNVGIGLATPQYPLDVVGNANFSGNISAGNLGMFRNRIINGDMRINQRAFTTVTLPSSTCFYTTDRMFVNTGSLAGTFTAAVNSLTSSDAPFSVNGIQSSLRVTNTANGSYNWVEPGQFIEGYNIQDFNWGTPNGSPVTISFWFRTNAAEGSVINAIMRNDTNSDNYATTFTINASGAWQRCSATIPAPPVGSVWNRTDGRGIKLYIGGHNTVYTSTDNIWSPINTTFTTTSTNILETPGNYVELTGVQLEKGTIATPFEFRPFAVELALCQRYYELIGLYGWMAAYNSPENFCCAIKFIVPKRAAPSVALIGTIAFTQPTHANYIWPTSSTSITRTDYTLTGCMLSIVQSNSSLNMTSSSIWTVIPGFNNGYNNTNVFAVSDEL